MTQLARDQLRLAAAALAVQLITLLLLGRASSARTAWPYATVICGALVAISCVLVASVRHARRLWAYTRNGPN